MIERIPCLRALPARPQAVALAFGTIGGAMLTRDDTRQALEVAAPVSADERKPAGMSLPMA
jgi:hypothetical protein